MSGILSTLDLQRLNALTRYPSILTYHPIAPKGSRSRGKHEEPKPLVRFSGELVLTEKVDGVNARMVVVEDGGFLIGSRDEFLYAQGDLLSNPAMNIVATIRPAFDRIASASRDKGQIVVWFMEVYGGRVTDGSRQYTGDEQLGIRLFDVLILSDAQKQLSWSVEQIGAWRESGGGRFAPEHELQRLADLAELPLTPRLGLCDADDLPTGIEDSLELLEELLPKSRVMLDPGGAGRAEGIVVRSHDRQSIAKLRFRDYQELCKGRKR